MNRFMKILCIVMAVCLGLVPCANACTSFYVKAGDGTVVVARSNEFGIDAKSQIVFEPAGKIFASKSPDGGQGRGWTSKYAFLGINGMGLKESFGDGMNEAGLSVEALYFTEGKYETPGPEEAANALSSNDFISWILSNFATADEVKKELSSVRVWGETVEELGGPFLLHFAVHDATGNCIVIEFIKGEKKVYDHPIGVMTNMPELPWQITNLRNFVNLNPLIPKAKDFNGVEIKPTGTGSGWLGIPGDWSPPSRFVRIAYLVNTAPQAKDRTAALNLAKHILNTVDIPLGAVQAELKSHSPSKESTVNGASLGNLSGKENGGQGKAKGGGDAIAKEYTQWSLLLDLSNRVMYYYTYDDMNLKSIDLKKLAAAVDAPVQFIPMVEDFSVADRTNKLAEMK